MPNDRDELKPKTPPQRVAEALTSGGRARDPNVPHDFAEGRDPITGVGLKLSDELVARSQRLQQTTDGSAMVITGQLAEHGTSIKALQADAQETKETVAEVKSDVAEIKVSVASMAGAFPHLTSAVQNLTSAAIQRETIISVGRIEVDTHEKIAEVEIEKEHEIAKIETAKVEKITRLERGTKLWAIVATLLAIGLAVIEMLR